MHPSSQQKTAFVTPQGLFEFRVIPFGLMIASSAFQLMPDAVGIVGLNPEEGPDHVSAYN